MTDFLRFPHTPHLAWLGSGTPRDDKVLSPAEAQTLLAEAVVIEEKLDGANLGLSISPDGTLWAQNRGQYLIAPNAWVTGSTHARTHFSMLWVRT